MTLPNWITFSRIPLLFIITGLFYTRLPGCATIALVLYIFAGITDWLDGLMARKMHLTSKLGRFMDALIDKIFMVGCYIVLLAHKLLPEYCVFFLLLILSREFLITGLRLVVATEGKVISAEKAGKQKTILQIISAGFLFLAFALTEDWPNLLSTFFIDWITYLGIIAFIGAALLTLYSGIGYLLKYRRFVQRANNSHSLAS